MLVNKPIFKYCDNKTACVHANVAIRSVVKFRTKMQIVTEKNIIYLLIFLVYTPLIGAIGKITYYKPLEHHRLEIHNDA